MIIERSLKWSLRGDAPLDRHMLGAGPEKYFSVSNVYMPSERQRLACGPRDESLLIVIKLEAKCYTMAIELVLGGTFQLKEEVRISK